MSTGSCTVVAHSSKQIMVEVTEFPCKSQVDFMFVNYVAMRYLFKKIVFKKKKESVHIQIILILRANTLFLYIVLVSKICD